MNDIARLWPCHEVEVGVMFLSPHCAYGPALILPSSTSRECLTSKERLSTDPENYVSQASLAIRLGILIQSYHQKATLGSSSSASLL